MKTGLTHGEPLHERHVPGSLGEQYSQSKLAQWRHSVATAEEDSSLDHGWLAMPTVLTRAVVRIDAVHGYLPAAHAILQRLPTRLAPGVQSASTKAVLGVGSTHCHSDGPLHFWHAPAHRLHAPLTGSAYWPSGQAETHVAPSRIACTLGGHVEWMHALKTQLRHCDERGPSHVLQLASHGKHLRWPSSTSA